MTYEELSKLTPEEKCVKIAEACRVMALSTECPECYGTGRSGSDSNSWPCGCKNGLVPPYYIGPDYLHDLNAMREALSVITYDQQPYYIANLKKVLMSESGVSEWDVHTAPAESCAAAFLLTL